MGGHGRFGAAVRLLLLLLLLTDLAPSVAGEPERPGMLPAQIGSRLNNPICSETMRSDAPLLDVCFVDPAHGWAVGGRGAIWHTDDGGNNWRQQDSAVACPLESVFFIDQKTGWAAGGLAHPYTHSSSGVLLTTHDAGRCWKHDPKLLLPALKQVRFFDKKRGWAIGGSSAMFPSGVFVTDNGGRNWQPLPGPKTSGWRAGDFLDPHTGALAGRSGTAAVVRRGGIEPVRTPPFGLRGLAGLTLVRPTFGWLIGDGALVMMTGEGGTSWQTPPGELPDGLDRLFDFAALKVRGPKCWIAGEPGSRVLHTADAGRSWTMSATGQNLPIHALEFVDDRHGWAVGALGSILATIDGGRSWRRQRSGGARAALLGVFSEGKHVPLELFVKLSGDEGYLGVVEVLNRRDVEIPVPQDTHRCDRLREALLAVGASDAHSAWRFPLRQAGLGLRQELIVRGWDRANDGRGLEQLEAHVVRQIRLWRPDVLLTHDAGPRGDDPLGNLVNRVVLRAVEAAADPTAQIEQITRAGLGPWRVKKVFASLPPGVHGATSLTTAKLAGRLGQSLWEVACGPRGLLEDRFTTAEQTLGFRLLVNHLPGEQSKRDFFSGIVLQPGGEARRELIEPAAETIETIRSVARKRRNIEAILERTEGDPQQGAGLMAQAGELVRGLDPPSAARILYHLGWRYHGSGQWDMAAEAFELLVARHEDHPLSRPALAWLLQYYASGEAAWRVLGKQRVTVRRASAVAIDNSRQVDRAERAAAIGRRIQQTRPAMFAEPAVRFPLAVVDRRRGLPQQAERFYVAQRRSPTRDAWWAAARGEEWLAEREGPPPKTILLCAPAVSKPRLDGRLEEDVWQRAKTASLQSSQHDDADWPAVVMLAYDSEFLYLAMSCRQAPGAKYPPCPAPRPRDPDLSAGDRVEVFLDLDRDFVSYYRLAIDHRGWTGEDCWGDHTWNPTWFVAARSEDNAWTAEAAVPLDELTGRFPAPGTVWAIGIQRTVPGVGFQSWTTPASTAVAAEGFGYLVFE